MRCRSVKFTPTVNVGATTERAVVVPIRPGERVSTASAIDLAQNRFLALVPFVGALRNIFEGARTFMCDDAVHGGKQFESEWSFESFHGGRLAGVQVLRLNNVAAYGVAHQLRH